MSESRSGKPIKGSTGHWPVPSGDSPDGKARTPECDPDADSSSGAAHLPVGESPAPPRNSARIEKRVCDLFDIKARFLRSAQLERDFDDPGAFSGYIVTDFTRSCLERMAAGLKPGSGQRAWRTTGDYGSGKSSFALLLAHLLAGRDSSLSP